MVGFFSQVYLAKKKKKLRSMNPSVNFLKGKFKQVQTNKILILDCYGNHSEMGLGNVASNSVSNGLRYTVPTQRVFILSIYMKRGLTKPGVFGCTLEYRWILKKNTHVQAPSSKMLCQLGKSGKKE